MRHGKKCVVMKKDGMMATLNVLSKAPNKEEFHQETCRRIKALHQYDCLRPNKSTSAWGLEARVPVLDKEFINVAMCIDPEAIIINMDQKKIEKWIIRRAFEERKRIYQCGNVHRP